MTSRMSFVEMFVKQITTSPTIQSTTFTPFLKKSTTVTTVSSDSSVPTDLHSMLSTFMVPSRPTHTVPPKLKELPKSPDKVTSPALFNTSYILVESVSSHSDVITEPHNTTKSSVSTMSDEDREDLSVIEISTIPPDVPLPDTSLSTKAMFVAGKTDKTILDSVITPSIIFVPTDTSAESSNLTTDKELGSSETTPPTAPPSLEPTTPISDYEENVFLLQAGPPTQTKTPEHESATPLEGDTAERIGIKFFASPPASAVPDLVTSVDVIMGSQQILDASGKIYNIFRF